MSSVVYDRRERRGCSDQVHEKPCAEIAASDTGRVVNHVICVEEGDAKEYSKVDDEKNVHKKRHGRAKAFEVRVALGDGVVVEGHVERHDDCTHAEEQGREVNDPELPKDGAWMHDTEPQGHPITVLIFD
jgi:hypothetical protein